jgi:phage-related holin
MGIDRYTKSIIAIKLALAASPMIYIIETYLFNDWEFLKYILILIVLDFIWALRLASKEKNISLQGFKKAGEKLIQYSTLLILGHILLHVRSDNEPITVLAYLTTLIHAYIISREGFSILEKQALINPRYVPKWLLDRLKEFRDTGKSQHNGETDQNREIPEDREQHDR